jgi:hypothetical protein
VRSALLLVLLLAAPLSLVHDRAPLELRGEEVRLTLPEGELWTQTAWDNAIQSGYVPLRIVSPTELIAWKLDQTTQSFDGVESINDPAPWQSIPFGGQFVTIVFEPSLPNPIQHEIIDNLVNQIGISILNIAQDAVLPHVTIEWKDHYSAEWFSEIDGVLWLEPSLETVSRNLASAVQLSKQAPDHNLPLAWELGLNGSGVVVGIADSGIDADHSCFRNLTSDSVGESQRKILHINTSIDDWDSQGHSDYRHGTHTAGSVGCHPVSTAEEYQIPSAAMALGYGTKLVVQDIVSEEGWLPPDVDYLLLESSEYGAVLHSDSWGDDTTEYTLRSGDFDAFTREYPWSLPLVAPGNNGGEVLEPANARNVIAIGASTKDDDPERWISSVHGPTEAGTRGIFALAPGVSITSARSDGQANTWNSGHHTLSGTSMSTPTAAGFASILEQMVRDGWFTGHNESIEIVDSRSLQPWFSNTPLFQHGLLLGEGFTPSAPLLKSLLALSTTPLSDEFRNGGTGGDSSPNAYDGWGRLNLSEVIDIEGIQNDLSQEDVRPIENIWIHDSYRLEDVEPLDLMNQRKGAGEPLESLLSTPWDGGEAQGPFLGTDDVFQQRFILQQGQDLDIRMAFQAKPEPHMVDDLQLLVKLPDGRFAVGDTYKENGFSMLYYDFADPSNVSAFPSTNETTVGVSLSAESLDSSAWVDVFVVGRYVTPGNVPNSIGVEGNKIGFGMAIQGVVLDPVGHTDADNDGVPYENDLCPFTDASSWDLNSDGCIDDTDADGVVDSVDACIATLQDTPVQENGCAEMNDVPQIFFDASKLIGHNNSSIPLTFSVIDADVVDINIALQRSNNSLGTVAICTVVVENDSWNTCTIDVENAFFPLSPDGEWVVVVKATDRNTSWWTESQSNTFESPSFIIEVYDEIEVESRDPPRWVLTTISAILLLSLLIATFLEYLKRERVD